MCKKWKGKKLNNKGYSMIEVITAVILLSAVAIPLLNSFITSLRVNTKAKQMQRVTAAAESVMEGFKAYHYDDLLKQFKSPNTSDFKIYNMSVTDGGTSVTTLEAYSCKDPSTDPSLAVSTTNNKGDSTTVDTGIFLLKGLNYQGLKLDVKVSIEPYESSVANAHNGTKAFNYFERMNGYKDGIFSQTLESVNNTYYGLLNMLASKLNEVDKIYGFIGSDPSLGYKPDTLDLDRIKVYRETTTLIEDKKATVAVVYKADATGYPYYDINGNRVALSGTDALFEIALPVETVYDTSAIAEAGAEIDNLFMFIFPVYNTDRAGFPFEEDKYDIKYIGSRDVKVFFVKQLNSTITPANLVTCENSLHMSGRINNVDLYHNVDTNLGNTSMHTGITSPFSLLGGATNHVGLSVEDDAIMVYKVNVEVYEEGEYDAGFTGSPLYKLEGTMSE